MLAFVIPVKSKTVSNSWETVCNLFADSLRAVLRQSSDDFRVFVVCHELPTKNTDHKFVEFIQVDPTDPTWDLTIEIESHKKLEFKRGYADVSRKKLVGVLAAREAGASHVMFVDADDFVSRRITEFVTTADRPDLSWYSPMGYEYIRGQIFHPIESNFHLRCGTSHIVSMSAFDAYTEQDVPTLDGMFMAHQEILKDLAKQGLNAEPLPFPGAVYRVEHGENLYAKRSVVRRWASGARMKTIKRWIAFYKKRLAYRRVKPETAKEFCLPEFQDRTDYPMTRGSLKMAESVQR